MHSEEKKKIKEMFGHIITAFQNRVNHLKWMSQSAKTATLRKIVKLATLISYPDWIINDALLNVYYQEVKERQIFSWSFVCINYFIEQFDMEKSTYFENLVKISKINVRRHLRQIVDPIVDDDM